MFSILVHLLLFSWPVSIGSNTHQKLDNIFDEIAIQYQKDNLDSIKLLAQSALRESRNQGDHFSAGRSLFFLGDVADEENELSKMIPYLLEALDQFSNTSSKKSYYYQAEICLTLGRTFRQHQDLHNAIDMYQRGIEYAVSAESDEALRKLLYNLSIAYRRAGEMEKALNVLTQSMDLISETDKKSLFRTQNQFGLIYTQLNQFEKARECYNKMIDFETNCDRYFRGQAYHNIALTYNKQNVTRKAWEFFELAAKEKENLGNPDKLFITYHDMAELAQQQGELQTANKYAQLALSLIDKVPETPDYFKIYKLLSESEKNRNPSLAVSYAQQYIAASERFNHLQEEMAQNGDKYKVELIATTYINKVKQEKERLKFAWSMSCSAVFVFLIIALTFKLYRIYRYRSPKLALSQIKSHHEMVFLLDMFRKEKEEYRNTLRQSR